MSKKTALIIGITSQDGSYLAELLLEKGYNVVGMARRHTSNELSNVRHLVGQIAIEYGDLIDPITMANLILKSQPDEVYNFAAQSIPADAWQQPITTAEITAVGPVRIMEAIRMHKPDAKFYQASSREMFGGCKQEVLNENAIIAANSPYGASKLYAHMMVNVYRQSYGLFACSGIAFNHDSPRTSLHFVTRKISAATACIKLGVANSPTNELGEPLISNNKVKLGNLNGARDWGYAKEFVEAMWLMLQQDKPDDYIIAFGSVHTVRNICEIAFGHVGLKWEDHVEVDPRFLRPTEVFSSRGDFSKAKKQLGWYPKTSFEELITMMVDKDLKLL